jgi:hypothetical protein
MSELLDSSVLRYAVIEALSTDADPERFVIAYGNEQALHDVIAARCIVAFGFSSREEAEASSIPCVSAGHRLEDNRVPAQELSGRWVQIHFEGATT